MPEFNAGLLLLARQYRAASQEQIAREAGLNQGYYSRIENGLTPDGPSSETVERIGSALNFPASFFYQKDGLAGLPLSIHPMNRRKSAVSERVLKQIHAELNIRLMHLRRYIRAVDIRPELPLPNIDVDDGGGPQEIARTLRKAWLIPDGPVSNLTDYCERAGILVIWCELANGIDGVSMNVRDLPPCIFLNRGAPSDRMRFSLAHELGHAVMHRIPTSDIEEEANAFAGELLLPEKQYRRLLVGQTITLEWLARQKAYWKTSMAFLLYRAGTVGAITRHQSEYLWKKISALGWRTREPAETEFAHEPPSVFPRLIRLHSEDMRYDLETLQRLLSMSAGDIQRIYGEHLVKGKVGLYVVK